jgi:hypothetical protein
MEDFDEMTSYGFNAHQGPPQPNYASAPQPHYASAPRYARKQSRYGPQQQTRFGGNFADPVLLQAAPFANAPPAFKSDQKSAYGSTKSEKQYGGYYSLFNLRIFCDFVMV